MKNMISFLIPKLISISSSSKVIESYDIKRLKSKFGESNVSLNESQIEIWSDDTWTIVQDGVERPFEGKFLAMIDNSLREEGISKLGMKRRGHVYYDPVRVKYTVVNCSSKSVFIGTGKNIDDISKVFRIVSRCRKQ
ncbi:hypothetical protein [uncultured Ilyobacter sp.]|uniref:hypothetical protein n=1 Tax=uncultured Ilyobacter sp. TaxID=544433 RepID=UPI002AA87F51|nr:hypothetical protein [uncultured Ilyobacter sp.]